MQEEKGDRKIEFIKWFSELDKNSVQIAGIKGANLGELYQLNIQIPSGFVITSDSYKYFFEKTGLNKQIEEILETLNYNNPENLKEVSNKIKDLINNTEFPENLKEEILENYEHLGAKNLNVERGSALNILNTAAEKTFVAVKASFPKTKIKIQENSFINIKGDYDILKYIKKCFTMLFYEKELFHKQKQKIPLDRMKMSVVVQQMINSDKSGIIYTKDFLQENENLKLKALWGLGQDSAKQIKYDEYTLSRALEIIDTKIENKVGAITRNSGGEIIIVKLSEEKATHQVLKNFEIKALGEIALGIENTFKVPQEIHFAIEGDERYITQTKPIKKKVAIIETEKEIKEISSHKILPIIPTKTKLKLILDDPTISEVSKQTNIHEIGLLDVNEIIKRTQKHPDYFSKEHRLEEYKEILLKSIKQISNNFNKLNIKLLDCRDDFYENLERAREKEENPLLGESGIRYNLENIDLFKTELETIKSISEDKDIGVIISKIISIDEIKEFKRILNDVRFNPKIGILIETPASLQLIKDFCEEGIDFIQIDIKRLTQNILSIDRQNPRTRNLYNEVHPAITHQLEFLLRTCKRNNVETNINFGKDELMNFLIDKKIDSINVYPEEAKEASSKIKEIEHSFVEDTDEEPRMYHINKEKEEIQKQTEEIEKNVPSDVEIEISENRELNFEENTPEDLEKNCEAIQKEKEEYLEENYEEESEENPEFNSEKDLELDEEIKQIEEDIKAIEKEKEEYTQEISEEKEIGEEKNINPEELKPEFQEEKEINSI